MTFNTLQVKRDRHAMQKIFMKDILMTHTMSCS